MENTEAAWTFDGTWPYAPKWFETAEGQMHFVDEGPRSGRPVVFVHGNPSWGYLYRNFIPPLVAAGFRVIIPDHLGFGRSDKPATRSAYSIALHAQRLDSLLESLDLENVTLVPHDWGGPIGLFWATRHPLRVGSLALFNTFLHRPQGAVALPVPLRLFRIRGVGELLAKGLHLIVKVFLLGGGVVRRERLIPILRRAYLAPHPTWSTRTGVLELARQFPGGPQGAVADFHDEIHERLEALGTRPVFIAWAEKDVVLGSDSLTLWLNDFPNARLLRLPDAGHFLQEDAHEQVIPALLEFLRGQPQVRASLG